MLLLLWLGGCSLVAASAAVVSRSDGPWLLGLVAVLAAQAAVVAGRTLRLPYWATWPVAMGCVAVGALGQHGMDLVLYLVVVPPLLAIVDRFAALSVGLSAFCLPEGGGGARMPGMTTLTDPVAREFAHARRQGSRLAVASISVPGARGASRRLARIARELVSSLRRTDVVVRVVTERLVVVLPGGDDRAARAVLGRALAGHHADVLVGIATFPEDGPTWVSLKHVAEARERAWTAGDGPSADGDADFFGGRFHRDAPAREASVEGSPSRPPVLLETRSVTRPLRRAADLVVLLLAAPIVVPVIALLALVVKLDTPGPAFVRIGRLGRDGRPFGLVKLRSMTREADTEKEALGHLNTLPWPDFKIAEDPRVTRTGRWLRKYSLDELPQLWNVLRGEMTLVGPRPCSIKLPDYEPWQGERLEATPGLAGRWQAEARGTADFAARSRLDIRQTQAGSIRMSLLLIVATLRSVLRSKGAV